GYVAGKRGWNLSIPRHLGGGPWVRERQQDRRFGCQRGGQPRGGHGLQQWLVRPPSRQWRRHTSNRRPLPDRRGAERNGGRFCEWRRDSGPRRREQRQRKCGGPAGKWQRHVSKPKDIFRGGNELLSVFCPRQRSDR